MSFRLETLRVAVAERGRVARVVVAGCDGSTPREVGAVMLVWADGAEGSIGGGALEWEVLARVRTRLDTRLDTRAPHVERIPLGPALGQCCGGAVTLVTEMFDARRVAAIDGRGGVFARPVGGPEEPPLAVRRILATARAGGGLPVTRLISGWLIEPISSPDRVIWVFGAGHVGRAIVAVLAPLPGLALSWIDTDPARFPAALPEGVERLVAQNPADLVGYAPAEAEHLVLTYAHALDLEICHRLLGHGFRSLGLIGSASKWARFRTRLRQLGHSEARINLIRCPIGDPSLGKHPQAIAVSVASALLKERSAEKAGQGRAGRGLG